MKNKKNVLISIGVLFIAFLAITLFYKNSADSDLKSFSQTDQAPFVRDYAAKFGKNEKNVTVVEFFDPECEACGLFHPLSKRVFNEYEEDVLFVVRYLANHANSAYVVKILEAARVQNKYMEVMDVVLDTQPLWKPNGISKPKLIWKYISNIKGLDIEVLKKDFAKIDVSNILSTDRADASTLKVRGTPTFFVNGKRLETLSYQHLLDLVESEIYK